MEKFEILEHKGDYKIRALGKTKEELFLNALLGMESGLRPKIKNQKSNLKNIEIKSLDLNALLVDFLSEVLYLIQADRETYDKIKFKKFSDTKIEAELSGKKVESFGEDIKAATYHGLDVHQNKDGVWEAELLFDV